MALANQSKPNQDNLDNLNVQHFNVNAPYTAHGSVHVYMNAVTLVLSIYIL